MEQIKKSSNRTRLKKLNVYFNIGRHIKQFLHFIRPYLKAVIIMPNRLNISPWDGQNWKVGIEHQFYTNVKIILTLFHAGVGIYAHPTTYRQFSPEIFIRGGSNHTLNLSFVITEHLKLVSGQKNFPTSRGRPPKSGGELIFWSVLPQNWL